MLMLFKWRSSPMESKSFIEKKVLVVAEDGEGECKA